MDVLISADIEGIVGVESWDDIRQEDQPGYARACELMTGEVNAAVEAGDEGGCKRIYVVDAHGEGNNLVRSELHAKCILLKKAGLRMMTGVDRVDLAIFLGYHGMAGKPKSFCAHTNSSRLVKSLSINGQEVSEGITNALIAKQFKVKTIFVAGTDKGVAEIKKAIPSIHSVVSLKSLSTNRAKSMPVEANLKKIKQGIINAIKNRKKIKMIGVPVGNPQFAVELKVKFPLSKYPNVKISENKVSFSARTVVDGYVMYRRILKLVRRSA